MRLPARRLIAVLLATAATAVLAPAAGAAARTPEIYVAGLPSQGPGDLFYVDAGGFRPGRATHVDLIDNSDASKVFAMDPIVPDDAGVVHDPDGYRSPADLVPGVYTLRISQRPGAVAQWSPVLVVAPEMRTYDDQLGPGGPVDLTLKGLGGDPAIPRTLALDGGAPVALPATTESVGQASGDAYGSVRVAGTLPPDLALGRHTLTLTQANTPAVTVTHEFTLEAPSLTVRPVGFTGLATRGTVWVDGSRFGPAGASVSVQDASGRVSALVDLDATGHATAVLPGVAIGDATFTAKSKVNETFATAVGRVLPSTLVAVSTLSTDARLVSPSGRCSLIVLPDADLLLYLDSSAVWSSGTPSVADRQPRLVVQADGNLVVYAANGAVIWNSRTSTTDRPARLSVLDEGRAVLTSAHGTVLWTTPSTDVSTIKAVATLTSGARLIAGTYAFAMQTDGNAVLYRGSTVLFRTNTAGNPGAALTLQNDGNLVLRSTAGRPLWANRATVGPGTSLHLQMDGNLVEYAATGKAAWSTGTAGH